MKNIDTLCVQGGWDPKSGEPRITPIIQSTTYAYENGEDLADLFDLKKDGYFYTRLANPTVSVLEEKVASLEGGIGGIGCSSGQSATLLSVLTVCNAGDNILCSQAVYGGTFNLLGVSLKKLGIETKFFNPDDKEENIKKLIDDKTRLIFIETVANPTLIIPDFEKFSKICRENGLMLYVDNTLASPALCRPIEYGANIVVHSTSKYIDGHACALGGMIIDAGTFNFKGNNRFPEFNTPDESYHGLVYADLKAAFLTKARAQMMRDYGAIMAPQNAFLTNLGCETLDLRMKKHVENAKKIAEFLESNPKIEWVNYPSLKSNKYYNLANKYLPNGVTGMLSFGPKGGSEAAAKLMNNLKLIRIVTHVADVRSSIIHPRTTTHRQMSDEDLKRAGIPENLLRLSVGIENVDDIINDLKQALERI